MEAGLMRQFLAKQKWIDEKILV